IIDGVDTEICDQVLLTFPLLPGSEDSLEPCSDSRQHQANNYTPEEFTGEDSFNPIRHGQSGRCSPFGIISVQCWPDQPSSRWRSGASGETIADPRRSPYPRGLPSRSAREASLHISKE